VDLTLATPDGGDPLPPREVNILIHMKEKHGSILPSAINIAPDENAIQPSLVEELEIVHSPQAPSSPHQIDRAI
jgi:hypothetical protein